MGFVVVITLSTGSTVIMMFVVAIIKVKIMIMFTVWDNDEGYGEDGGYGNNDDYGI